MIEPLLFGAGAGAAGWVSMRYAWWRPSVAWRYPRVLTYHMVRPHRAGARFNKLRVIPAEFARQIAWLVRQGFSFVWASELFSGKPLPERCVCLTFDDGYADNLIHADPILAEHGAKGTLYLVEERDQGWSSKKKSHHPDDELKAEPKLSDDQVRQMLNTGRWELGGHTRTHANLLTIEEAAAREEIASARERFPQKFGVLPDTFSYPFGLYRSEHVEMVREAGFVGALTTHPGIFRRTEQHPLEVPRIKVSGNDHLFGFTLKLRGGKRGLWK